jgi:arabinofuranan 3-O-arabinosyltransferase
MTPSLAEWADLVRLGRGRLRSPEAYQEFQRFQGDLLVRHLAGQGVTLAGSRVVDVGCGYGGYASALQAAGAGVVAVDLLSADWPRDLMPGLTAVAANGLSLPFAAASADLVVCASLVEHVASPERLLAELHRISRPGGLVYISFPPFYTPRGGHQFSPFHYLGERRALRMARRFGRLHESDWVRATFPADPDSFSTAWGDWGLYRMTIGRFEGLLGKTDYVVRDRSTRLLPVDFSGIPLLRELLTWHVQYLLEKPVPARRRDG